MANFDLVVYYLNVIQFPNIKFTVMGFDIFLEDILPTQVSADEFVAKF